MKDRRRQEKPPELISVIGHSILLTAGSRHLDAHDISTYWAVHYSRTIFFPLFLFLPPPPGAGGVADQLYARI